MKKIKYLKFEHFWWKKKTFKKDVNTFKTVILKPVECYTLCFLRETLVMINQQRSRSEEVQSKEILTLKELYKKLHSQNEKSKILIQIYLYSRKFSSQL